VSYFKRKYHGSLARSKNYAAREIRAKSRLVQYLGHLYYIYRFGKGVEKLGIIKGVHGPRFDFILKPRWGKLPIILIEVTGDRIDDYSAYVLCEKLWKARKLGVQDRVWVMYNKEARGLFSFRFFNAAELLKTIETGRNRCFKFSDLFPGEGPMLRVDYDSGLTIKQFVKAILNG